jgi:hypothetical protein
MIRSSSRHNGLCAVIVPVVWMCISGCIVDNSHRNVGSVSNEEKPGCRICGFTGVCLNCQGKGRWNVSRKVPVPNCTVCRGSGIAGPYGKCGYCASSGKDHKRGGYTSKYTPCSQCKGSGKCPICNRQGRR